MGVSPEVMLGMNLLNTASGTYSQASALKSQSSFERQQLNANAAMANLQAKDAQLRGKREADLLRKSTDQMIGTQRAAYGGQGIDPNKGTAALVQEQTAGMGAADAQTIESNSFLEALGFQSQAQQYRSQAKFTQLAARNQYRNTLLSGVLQGTQAVGTYGYLKSIQPGKPPGAMDDYMSKFSQGKKLFPF